MYPLERKTSEKDIFLRRSLTFEPSRPVDSAADLLQWDNRKLTLHISLIS